MQPTETITVNSTTVGCDGGGDSLGHPKVYISLEKGHEEQCPYCGQRFVPRPGVKAGGH
jgi:uncharacterized Zn-finger protein